jgi:hypothetical protein
MIDFAALAAPFPPDRVSFRVGSTTADKSKGMALAYIDARDVYDRLDAVCGPGGWQCRYPHADKKTVCDIGIKVGDEWVWKSNGAGDSDVEAEKGALSDAVKRAAVVWGIGRYLYDLDSPWVPIEAKGKSYVITDEGKAKLRQMLARNATGAPAEAPKRIDPPAKTSPDGLADKLMKTLSFAKDARDFDEIKNDPDFKTQFQLLGLADRARVAEHGKTVRAGFLPVMAG